ncbi:NADH-quinone oxidoreductase subunit K [Porphyrobacter sp. GA68]|uniref:NADH-quinone oxidoreductase subunit K n=1 Tax=Porphyrobacter sp. GA68 TaxID=2883480 RepID=UPI001D18371F|nr:NADH-quinone oxidoreductase subunit K [Porphyrobacter sp. GA68]
MTQTLIFGLTGAALIALGFYGFVSHRHLLRQIVAFNLIGSGLFLLFGALARRAPDGTSDPVPQAMIITGIVVSFAATALAEAIAERLHDRTGRPSLPDLDPDDDD